MQYLYSLLLHDDVIHQRDRYAGICDTCTAVHAVSRKRPSLYGHANVNTDSHKLMNFTLLGCTAVNT